MSTWKETFETGTVDNLTSPAAPIASVSNPQSHYSNFTRGAGTTRSAAIDKNNGAGSLPYPAFYANAGLTTSQNVYMRAYYYLSRGETSWTGSTFPMAMDTGYDVRSCGIGIKWLGTRYAFMDMRSGYGTYSSSNVPIGSWFRVEFYAPAGTGASVNTIKLFLGADVDSATPTETFSGTSPTTYSGYGGGTALYPGIMNTYGMNNLYAYPLYVDDFAVSTDGWIGTDTPSSSVKRGIGIVRA